MAHSSQILIPVKNQVVLKKDYTYLGYKEFWDASKVDTEKALQTIYSFLSHPEEHTTEIRNWEVLQDHIKSEINTILGQFSEYKVQFVGVIVDGKRRVYCNFFPSREEYFKDWDTEVISVDDGGSWFWQIEYDIETNKCFNFMGNGYA